MLFLCTLASQETWALTLQASGLDGLRNGLPDLGIMVLEKWPLAEVRNIVIRVVLNGVLQNEETLSKF